jgi:hypothetical protein
MQLALVRVRLAGTMPDPKKLWDQAVADARDAVEREPTNWRTWLTLTRIEARVGRLPDAVRDNGQLGQLARGSPLVPTYQQLLDLSTSKDVSLSPESKINSQP